MPQKTPKAYSDLGKIKKCPLHGVFYVFKCPICNEEVIMKPLKFYDLKTKKSFVTSKYDIVIKKGRKMAIAKAPSGIKSSRILGKA